jgi:hypothetical protein
VKVIVVVRTRGPRLVQLGAPARRRLEPEADFLAAVRLEERRVADGWAPFWHYRGLGRYGGSCATVPARASGAGPPAALPQVVDSPRETLDRVSDFLGVASGVAHAVPPENVKPYVADTARYRALSRVVRAGAALGAYAPPQVWRQVGRPLLAALHAGRTPRPPMPVEVRREVLEPLLPDIELLEELTGESFADWKGDTGRGDFRSRAARSTPS